MKYEKLPFGDPIFFEGQYQEDNLYPLYVQELSCIFELKDGMIPTLQIKNNLSFLPNEYVKSSNGDIVTLVLTNVDLDLFLKHYNIIGEISYKAGWKFKAIKGMFSTYIDYWSDRKIQAKKDKNDALYKISKLMLNSLYGKYGLNPNVRSKYPYLNEEEIVKYKLYDAEIRDSIYIPVASFITSYARYKTITTSQKIRDYTLKKYNKDLYVYSDTDSIHVLLDSYLDEDNNVRLYDKDKELESIIDIDDYKLGAWKVESRFVRGKYLRQKCYIELGFDNKLNVTVAGLPKKLSKLITFDNFKIGFTTENIDTDTKKLTYKHVKGGVLLVDTDFSIK